MARNPRLIASLTAAAAALTLASCGGGGGGASPAKGLAPSAGTPTPAAGTTATAAPSQGTGTLSFAVVIPTTSTASGLRRPRYVSPNTASLTVALQGQTPLLGTVNLSASATGCTSGVNGITCTVNVNAPAGSDLFTVATYDGANGTGHQLSVATVGATVVANSTNTLSLTLNAVAATVTVILGQSSLPVGSPGSVSVVAQAYDGSGNVIIGPGTFTNPITLTITGDTWSTLSLSTPIITAPGQVVSLAYNGNSLAGATITPSATGLTATNAATFAASGVSLSYYQPTYSTASGTFYLYPYGVAALPNGQAAVLLEAEYPPCCATTKYVIGIANSTGVQTIYAGDSSDPFNHAAPGLTLLNTTVINGMNNDLEYDQVYDSYRLLAADANGQVYYAGQFTSPSDPLCPGGSASSGLIGKLNPTSASVTEFPLKGTPDQIRVDSSGDIFFTEKTGSCSTTGNLLPSTYAVGEIASGGAITEVPYSTLGLAANAEPYDMDITPDGKTMFIADETNDRIIKISNLSSAVSIAPTYALDPYTLAAAPDGTMAWWSDEDPENQYYWGFIRGSSAFSSANAVEQTFPATYLDSYSMTYGDGSFWIAGADEQTGIGRIANVVGVTSGTPVSASIQVPYPDEEGFEFYGVSVGGGYVWAWDDDEDRVVSLQYGAAKPGVLNPAAIRIKHAGSVMRVPKPPTAASLHRRAPGAH